MERPRLIKDNIVLGVSETSCLFWELQMRLCIIGPLDALMAVLLLH